MLIWESIQFAWIYKEIVTNRHLNFYAFLSLPHMYKAKWNYVPSKNPLVPHKYLTISSKDRRDSRRIELIKKIFYGFWIFRHFLWLFVRLFNVPHVLITRYRCYLTKKYLLSEAILILWLLKIVIYINVFFYTYNIY